MIFGNVEYVRTFPKEMDNQHYNACYVVTHTPSHGKKISQQEMHNFNEYLQKRMQEREHGDFSIRSCVEEQGEKEILVCYVDVFRFGKGIKRAN